MGSKTGGIQFVKVEGVVKMLPVKCLSDMHGSKTCEGVGARNLRVESRKVFPLGSFSAQLCSTHGQAGSVNGAGDHVLMGPESHVLTSMGYMKGFLSNPTVHTT